MGTMKAFINKHGIKITSDYADSNPNMDDSGNMNHFKVKLTSRIDGKRRQLTTYFSMGYGLHGDPKAEDVLDCLASDASGVENARSFEDWAGDYGYDTDSRKAERTYKIIERQSKQLKRLLGEDAYKDLLWETERL